MQSQATRKQALSKHLNVPINNLEYFGSRHYHYANKDYLVLANNESEAMCEHEMNGFVDILGKIDLNMPDSLEKTAKALNHLDVKRKLRLYGRAHIISDVCDVETRVNINNQDFYIYEV